MKPAFLILLCVLVLGCQSSHTNTSNGTHKNSHQPTANNQAFDALLDTIWEYEQQAQSGGRGVAYDTASLPDISLNAKQDRHAQYQAYIDQVRAFDSASLTPSQRISQTIQLYRLQNVVDQFHFQSYLVPITSEYGFHSQMLNLRFRFAFDDAQDYADYLSLLDQLPEYFAQQIAYMREGIRMGYTQPQVVLQGFEASVAAVIHTDPSNSPFFAPFLSLPDAVADHDALQQQAKASILLAVNPAYQAFYDFLVDEYIPNAKTSIAAKDWPNGEAYYNNRIKHYTTLDMSAREIHEVGLQEVARIRSEMQQVLDELEFEGSIADFIAFLRTDPQFYAQSSRELIAAAMVMSKRMDALLPQLFKHLPRIPYGVAPVPDDIAPKYTTGRYISPRNDNQPGYYWVNTYALDKRPLYALPALTLHEAVPGHHLQISLANEMQDLPEVRRFTYISAFGEGWGLYSEYLGKEVGFYQTPYEEFGRLSYEMWRACRLVVDTGMHMFGWTRAQAIDYMLANTALSEHNVNTEIDRYISWPAQALAYKLGEILIRDYRAKAEAALGERFDIREFHDVVLRNGSIPLSLLEQELQDYIALRTGVKRY